LERANGGPVKFYSQIQQDITSFFREAERASPEDYKRLKIFIYGKIVSDAFLNRPIDRSEKIEDFSIYLDTHVVFSLMGYHEDSYNTSAKELTELAKGVGATLKIFSFTLEELRFKLKGYLNDYGFYSSYIPVRSIYYILKKKGVTKLDMMSILESLEEKVSALGITIDYSFIKDDLIDDGSDVLSQLMLYRPDSSVPLLKHDVASLLAIRKLRPSSGVYSWRKSRAIFLTSDSILTPFDLKYFSHTENRTFPEAVSQGDMASLFWLQGATNSDNVFLHNLFASHTRTAVIGTGLWEHFVEELKKGRESGRLLQADIDHIISLSETEVILREKKEGGIQEILSDENISKIKKVAEQKNRVIVENESLISSQADKFIAVNNAIIEESQKFWSKVFNWVGYFVILIAVTLLGWSVWEFGISAIANVIQICSMIVLLGLAVAYFTKKPFILTNWIINLRLRYEGGFIAESIQRKKEKYRLNS